MLRKLWKKHREIGGCVEASKLTSNLILIYFFLRYNVLKSSLRQEQLLKPWIKIRTLQHFIMQLVMEGRIVQPFCQRMALLYKSQSSFKQEIFMGFYFLFPGCFLVHYQTAVSSRTWDGKTPIDIAKLNNQHEVLIKVLENDALL